MNRSRLATLSLVLLGTSARAAAPPKHPDLTAQQQFQAAAKEYDSGNYAEAVSKVQPLLVHQPHSFEVQELAGMAYAALGQDSQAIEHLQLAVQLRPADATAHTSLAASLSHTGRTQEAGIELRKALALEPNDYTANHNLGEFLAQSGDMGGALTYLAKAQQLQPQQYDNGYDLAMADLMTGHFAEGRKVLHTLLAVHDTGELHNLLAQIEEKDGQYVVAANEFERAAHLDPSESALFDWGSELLLHRTYEPAIDVFKAAAQRYPTSSRLQIGLGMSYYARGLYEDAVKALLAAADLAPADARCYLFLSRASDSSPSQANEVTDRFARYAKLQPQNALAQYYYAMSLWRGARAQGNVADMQQVETLLLRAIALNDNLAEAHEQLGNLYADQKQYERSIPQYLRAVELDNSLADAHYRLGTDYVHLGHKDQAEAEFAVYRKLRAEHLAEVDKERSEVQQFVYDSKTPPPARP